MLKRIVSLRRFFSVPTTYVLELRNKGKQLHPAHLFGPETVFLDWLKSLKFVSINARFFHILINVANTLSSNTVRVRASPASLPCGP